MFDRKLINRSVLPEKRILVVEDNLTWQTSALLFLKGVGVQSEGKFQTHVHPTIADAYSGILHGGTHLPIALIMLDHDTPEGTGVELLQVMANCGHPPVPIFTYSGIEANNLAMTDVCNRIGYPVFMWKKRQYIEVTGKVIAEQMKGVLGL